MNKIIETVAGCAMMSAWVLTLMYIAFHVYD